MSKQSAQLDLASQWIDEARAALRAWGAYYRAGFSGLSPSDSLLGKYYSGQVQQPISVVPRSEAENVNDRLDRVVSSLPSPCRRAIVEVYGMRYSYRRAAERAGMNVRAFRDLMQQAEGGVAVGMSFVAG